MVVRSAPLTMSSIGVIIMANMNVVVLMVSCAVILSGMFMLMFHGISVIGIWMLMLPLWKSMLQ